MEFLTTAGPTILPLIACSLLAGIITFERILSLRRGKVLPREIVEVVESAARDAAASGREVAIDVCRRNPGVLSNVLVAGLERADRPWEEMRDAVHDVGREEVRQLERHLVWLQTIAQAAPLLGLLGTVLGMIKVFAAISVTGLDDPEALSSGISEAMITTAVGLAVGIPTLVAYNLLTAKAEGLIGEIEGHARRLVARLRP